MSASKYDIAEQSPYTGWIGAGHTPEEGAAWKEQSRLQAAFCEAYEALRAHDKTKPPRGTLKINYRGDLIEENGLWPAWRERKRILSAALDAAWAALQQQIGETR